MTSTFISGTGYALPERRVLNSDIVSMMNTSESFILERTGVFSRFHQNGDAGISELMIQAGQRAIADAGLKPSDIDCLIVNTLSPDHHDPSQACLIQKQLELRSVPAFDIRAQCSGFLYGYEIASHFLQSGKYRHVLLICGEALSKRMDCSDKGRNLAILLGDGAGAAVISRQSHAGQGMLDLELGADGDFFDLLMTHSPGSSGATFLSQEAYDSGQTQFVMQGKPMFDHASTTLTAIATAMLNKHGLTLNAIDYVLCHQPNLRILDAVRENLSLPPEKLLVTVDQLGNMASASFPVTYAISQSQFKPGNLILMLTYGSGATWGAALYQVPVW
ncbi:beta-ketoacyl-ACP synthase 3 [Photobacterium sp. 1_MG-2023]|uniref:beta-ketoacyl-ACP synthase 3 n=1 Tax=Photobacterium sp. 1_MG-2023 TaxID=3062646 RepID=UPI0026E41949|nr:beta-ketoacyl-ACP synthase 3 [Photobacterium sp. 1_MG-2023]MDO6708150.1 beta-ketoacyl-ACP synthase 3 [Photobacterium sp. 1_MG-2023]